MGSLGRTSWAVIAVVIGSLIAFGVHRSQTGDVRDRSLTLGQASDVDAAAAEVPAGPLDTIELTDVYTSDEAARRAYEGTRQRQVATQVSRASGVGAPAQMAEPFWALLDDSTVADPDVSDDSDTDDGLIQTAVEVAATVEAFLQDAVLRRDPFEFAARLDEGFRYTFDSGTPGNTNDDLVYERDEYERLVVPQLFDPEAVASVSLSEPIGFEQLDTDVTTIVYDYDIRLQRPSDTARFAGTAAFLVVRDPTDGAPEGWRILDWMDSPPSAE